MEGMSALSKKFSRQGGQSASKAKASASLSILSDPFISPSPHLPFLNNTRHTHHAGLAARTAIRDRTAAQVWRPAVCRPAASHLSFVPLPLFHLTPHLPVSPCTLSSCFCRSETRPETNRLSCVLGFAWRVEGDWTPDRTPALFGRMQAGSHGQAQGQEQQQAGRKERRGSGSSSDEDEFDKMSEEKKKEKQKL